MIILNLFIGVIMSGMEAAQQETEEDEKTRRLAESGEGVASVADEMDTIVNQIGTLQKQLSALKARVEKEESERS